MLHMKLAIFTNSLHINEKEEELLQVDTCISFIQIFLENLKCGWVALFRVLEHTMHNWKPLPIRSNMLNYYCSVRL